MPILINYKICDKGKGCPCIASCPAKAWYWDEKNKRPAVDNSKCNNCYACVKMCPARAVLFSFNEEGLKELKEEVQRDVRTEKDLLSERYNADPINAEILLDTKNFDSVINSNEIVLVEFWAPQFLSRCRINAIAYKDFLPKKPKIVVKKMNAEQNQEITKKYKVFTLPSLVLFYKGKPIEKFGRISACSSIAEKDLLKEKIENALKNIS
jgi:NAD-dependent dihydropyrimidine dehydrogenase PreA subunit